MSSNTKYKESVQKPCQTFPLSVLCNESNKGDKEHLAILVCMWGHTRLASY